MSEMRKSLVLLIFILTCVNSMTSITQAQEDTSGKLAILTDLLGTVQISHDGGGNWQAPTQGDFMSEGDWVRTQASSTATVAFDANYANIMTLQESTQIRIAQLRMQAVGSGAYYAVDMPEGDVDVLLDGLQPGVDLFEIRTPTAVIAARGSMFAVAYSSATGVTDFDNTEGTQTTYQLTYTNGQGAGTAQTAIEETSYTIPSAGAPPATGTTSSTPPTVTRRSHEDEEAAFPAVTSLISSSTWTNAVRSVRELKAAKQGQLDLLRAEPHPSAEVRAQIDALRHHLRRLRNWLNEVERIERRLREGEIAIDAARLPTAPTS